MSNPVYEKNTYRIRASFTDDSGAAVTPTSGSYRVDDITSNALVEIIDTTAFTPSTTYYDIIIPSSSNVLIDQSREEETRLVTVIFSYGSGRQGAGKYEYTLKNLKSVENLT